MSRDTRHDPAGITRVSELVISEPKGGRPGTPDTSSSGLASTERIARRKLSLMCALRDENVCSPGALQVHPGRKTIQDSSVTLRSMVGFVDCTKDMHVQSLRKFVRKTSEFLSDEAKITNQKSLDQF